MRPTVLLILALPSLLIVPAALILAASAPAPTTASSKENLVYVPPAAGEPRTRVTALTRGANAAVPLVCVIAPDHAGVTLSESPRLYWYLSDATDLPVGISVIREEDGESMFEVTLTRKTGAGFHCLDLAKENVKLEQDKRYQFVVAVIPDIKDRSKDAVTSGIIVRRKEPDALAKGLAAAQGLERASVLLKSGIWFDGISALMSMIEGQKDNESLIAARDALLQQIGLSQITAKALKANVPGPKSP